MFGIFEEKVKEKNVSWKQHLDNIGKEEFEFEAEYTNFEGTFSCKATGIRDKPSGR